MMTWPEQKRLQHREEAKIALDLMMHSANLPEESRVRLRRAFCNASNTEGMKEAVNVELRHVATLEAEPC